MTFTFSFHRMQMTLSLAFLVWRKVYWSKRRVQFKSIRCSFLFSFIESIATVPSEGALPLLTWRYNKFCLPLRFLIAWKMKVCPTLCNPMDCSLPSPFVHGIFQARILERVAISSSMGSSWPRDWTHVSCIGRRILYHQVTLEALNCPSYLVIHA